MSSREIGTLIAGTLLVLCAVAAPAPAAFPGQNGKIAFYSGTSPAGVWTVNTDGTGQAPLRAGTQPAWSADGQALLFVREDDIRRMPADGGSETALLNAGGFPICCSGYSWQTPAWSPDGTRIVASLINGELHDEFYLELYTASAAGSNQQLIAYGEDPTWRLDGSRIAFTAHTGNGNSGGLSDVAPNGSGEQTLVDEIGWDPDYSPDGTKLVYSDRSIARGLTGEIYVITAAGAQIARLTNNTVADFDPVWSPDGTKIAFVSNRDGNNEIYVMNADGSGQTRITNDPENQMQPSWQPTFGSGYPRPKGATPTRVSLVPAYAACTAPNRTHGPPLAYGSCNPPTQESTELTVGDAPAGMIGSVRYGAILGDPATEEDEADLGLRVQITDVRVKDTLADYAGEVQAQASTRMTDRTGSAGDPATATDIRFPLTTACTPTADPGAGSTCSLDTTLDALIPGAVVERGRTILQLGQVRVIDGGPDADVATEPNSVFLRQGVFVP